MPIKPQPTPQSNSQNNILIGNLIAGELIGASVIISQVLPKSSQSTADKTLLPSQTPSTHTAVRPYTRCIYCKIFL